MSIDGDRALHLERAEAGGPFEEIRTLTGGTLDYTDPLPLDGIERRYRAYVTAPGRDRSPYSVGVGATPKEL